MNERDGQALLIKLWLDKAKESFASAQLELDAGHISFAVNRLYYTCFYAVTALFQKEGKTFKRHTGVIAEFNRAYVKTGQFESKWSKFYQKLYDRRQEGDYLPATNFEPEEISANIEEAREFLEMIELLIDRG